MDAISLENKNQASQKHKEGFLAKAIEQQTSKIPSDTFLWLALGSIGTSLMFQLLGKKETSNFIGQWAPTLLIMGLYNKLVKLQGSDGTKEEAEEDYPEDQIGREASLAS